MGINDRNKGRVIIILIFAIVLVFFVQRFFHKREMNNLLSTVEQNTKLLEKKLSKDRESITKDLEIKIREQSDYIKSREKLILQKANELSAIKSRNKNLNEKLKEYEKKLYYSDRSLDDALSTLSKYQYNTDTRTKEGD